MTVILCCFGRCIVVYIVVMRWEYTWETTMPPHGDCENDNLKIQRKKYTHKHKTQVIQLIEYAKSLSFGWWTESCCKNPCFGKLNLCVCGRVWYIVCVYNTFSSIHTRYTKGTMNWNLLDVLCGNDINKNRSFISHRKSPYSTRFVLTFNGAFC